MKSLQTITIILCVGMIGMVGYALQTDPLSELGGSISTSVNTVSDNWTNATTSVTGGANTSTRVFASINKWGYIFNSSPVEVTCALNVTNGTTSLQDFAGVVLSPKGSSTSLLPRTACFGECQGGQADLMFPHKGSVSCRGVATATISVISR